jgi:2-polyprenyl-3-methyl-5-hydroxy-6-metoxy-1,4-benzoquinol methylase
VDLSIYHRFFEVEDRHWWFVGRRAVVEVLLDRAVGVRSDPVRARTSLPPGPAARPDGSGSPGRRLLDIGCGTGGMLPLLSRYGAVTGIDSEPVALDYCRKRGFTDLHLQEGFAPAAPYDVVTLFDVLEHVEDEAGFLAWIRALTVPGGRLVLTVPANPWLWSRHDELNHHRRRYTRRTLVRALESAGFRVERATHFNFWLFPLAVASRLLDARKGRAGVDPARDAEEILAPLRIGALNGPLAALFASEAGLVRSIGLPWGVSLGAVARRSD